MYFEKYILNAAVLSRSFSVQTNIFNIFYMYILSIFRIVLFIFTTAVMIHGRQVEIASSLDFLWKQQAKKELEEMSEMRRHTNQLLQNILPIHVAKYFLEQDRQAEVK